jgi:hypothetical protein
MVCLRPKNVQFLELFLMIFRCLAWSDPRSTRSITNSREAPQAGYLSHTYMRSGNGLFYETGFMKMAARPNGIAVVVEQTTGS